MILFHGTRANPDSIIERGLIPHGLDNSKEGTIDRVLAEFGLTRDTCPDWVWRYELLYERERGQDHSHLCLNKPTAAGYADMGGEPAYVVRLHVLQWLNRHKIAALEAWDKKKGTHKAQEFKRQLNSLAESSNGPSRYVVGVRVDADDPVLEKDVFGVLKRVDKLDQERGPDSNVFQEFTDTDPYEVRYYGTIPPEKIISIEEVISPPGFGRSPKPQLKLRYPQARRLK